MEQIAWTAILIIVFYILFAICSCGVMCTQIIFLIANCGRAPTISQFSARNPSNFKSLLFCIFNNCKFIYSSIVLGDLILSYVIETSMDEPNTATLEH